MTHLSTPRVVEATRPIRRGCALLPAALTAAALVLPAAEARADEDAASEEAESREKPTLDLEIWERGPSRDWRLRIVNRSEHPVRLATDPRLLWFEVTVPGRKKSNTCRLPDVLFPKKVDRDFTVVLKPDRAFAIAFDPRLYCFDEGSQKRLVPGALLKPRYGWPEKTKTVWKGGKREEVVLEQEPPYAVESVREDGPVAPVKTLEGDPIALRSAYAAWSGARIDEDGEPPDEPYIQMVGGSDARSEMSATVSVKLVNPTKKSERVYFRRELVTYHVLTPDGLVHCRPSARSRAPDGQAFLTLRAGGSLTVTSRLIELCPQDTFARPGLYLINATFHARYDGSDFGYDAFVGDIESHQPTTVRIRTGHKPFLVQMHKTPPRGKGRRGGPRGEGGPRGRDGEAGPGRGRDDERGGPDEPTERPRRRPRRE